MGKINLKRVSVSLLLISAVLMSACERKPVQQKVDPLPQVQGMKEGVDYRSAKGFGRIPGKIMVRDYFWYGCPHCYAFDKASRSWRDATSRDRVLFVHVPVSLGSRKWEVGQRFHLALAKQHMTENEHSMIFAEVQENKLNIADKEALIAWAGTKGWDKEKLAKDWDSPETDKIVESINQESKVLELPGTPGVLVDGQYVLDANFGMPSDLSEKAKVILNSVLARTAPQKQDVRVVGPNN